MGKQGAVNFVAKSSATFVFSNRLRKQADMSIPLRQQFPGIQVLAGAGRGHHGRFVFHPVFEIGPRRRLVEWHSCLFPEVFQLERPTGSVGRLHREKVRGARPGFALQKWVLEHHESSRPRSRFSRGPDAKCIHLGHADKASEMVVLTNAPSLSEHTISLPESLSVWSDHSLGHDRMVEDLKWRKAFQERSVR